MSVFVGFLQCRGQNPVHLVMTRTIDNVEAKYPNQKVYLLDALEHFVSAVRALCG